MKTILMVALTIAAIAADVPQTGAQQAGAPSPQTTAPPAGTPRASAPSDAQVAPRKWEVARVRCSDLLNAADDDRASAMMFYYGYLAATAGIRVINVDKISENIEKVMKQCEAQSSLTVPEAFRKALASRK
jgi:hypothetical protein